MYLITVEGGDGSGKGEAVRILSELLRTTPFEKSIAHMSLVATVISENLRSKRSNLEIRRRSKKRDCLQPTDSIIPIHGLNLDWNVGKWSSQIVIFILPSSTKELLAI